MKKLSKIIAVSLAVLMTASVFCLPAFAEDDPYAVFREGTGYVAIGDSFTRGYGAGDTWQDEIYLNDSYGNYNCRNVVSSYPNLIAKTLGLYAPDDIRDTDATFWPIAHDALSTAYILDLLGIDDGYRDEEFLYHYSYMTERYETDLRYFGDPESYALDGQSLYGQTGEVMSIREIIRNAKLITIQVGQSDIIYKAQIFGLNTLDLSDIANLPAGIGNILSLLTNYFEYWKSAYPLLLDYIKEVNPDAKVVLIGTMNPIKNTTATDDISIKIGGLIDFIFTSMNTYSQKCALEYGYTYVDITDVESPSCVTQTSIAHILSLTDDIEYGIQAHPTTKGYAQIADRVIEAVDIELEKDALDANFSIKAFFEYLFNFIKLFFTKFARLF